MRRKVWLAWLALVSLPGVSSAELVDLVIHRRELFAGGKPFGETGPYVKLVGVARFAIDPDHPAHRDIADLALAPRNAQGKVEFRADVYILAPADLRKGNGTILYDVNNRGNKLALVYFNEAPGNNDPTSEADAGNGFLMRRGYTIVWSGWIGELLPGNHRLLLEPPPVLENGRTVRGLARFEMSTDIPVDWLPLSRRPGHGSYRPTEEGLRKAELTWRMREGDPRVLIPREQWRVEIITPKPPEQGVSGTLPEVRLYVAGGFRPGYLYELITEVEGAFVQGVGFAGVRDLVSFLRYDKSERNPLRVGGQPAIQRAYAFGVSQSARFLRHFLYLGFNADERGGRVFDAVWPHVSGGGLGFFNHRFAQPTRHNGQHEDHAYPADMFPFTYGDSYDPFQQREDGILRRLRREHPECVPKIFHTQSAAEYWHRSGSLVHTDPQGRQDAVIPPQVRIYAFAGTQHSPGDGSLPAPGKLNSGHTDLPTNPANYRPLLRALLDALDAWVKDNKEPPPSV
ncbi:MAG: alpha/beta hydrolase domain-containing protein, partial [Gemmatales bacterium]|nr:alpha/beta hydrolase domain-containing protein [Gemmatales bacterium]